MPLTPEQIQQLILAQTGGAPGAPTGPPMDPSMGGMVGNPAPQLPPGGPVGAQMTMPGPQMGRMPPPPPREPPNNPVMGAPQMTGAQMQMPGPQGPGMPTGDGSMDQAAQVLQQMPPDQRNRLIQAVMQRMGAAR